jgi:hypothetical protein
VSGGRFTQLSSLLACALALCSTKLAFAQNNPAAAEALFDQARAAMAAGSYDIACARFRDSDKLDPAVGTRFNLADCEEKRGRLATAWSLFRGVMTDLAQDDDRRPIAEERAKNLEPRLPIVTLVRTKHTPTKVRVRVDGVELGEASYGVPLPMDPGQHDLSIVAEQGAQPESRAFSVKEAQTMQIPLQLAGAEPAAEQPAADAAPAVADDGSRRRWALIAGGIGAGGVVFGSVTGLVTLSKKSTADANCSNSREMCNSVGVDANESGKTFAMLSTLGFGVGVVGLGVGTYLWLTSPAHPSAPAATARLLPKVSLGDRSGFVSVAGRF